MFTKRPALNSTSSKKSLMLIFLVWVQMDLWQCGWCYLCRCVTLQCTADRSFDCFKTDETKRRRRGECARRRHASIAVRWLCTVCTVCTVDALVMHSVHIQSVHTLVIHTLHAVYTLVMHSVRSGRTGYEQRAHAGYAPDGHAGCTHPYPSCKSLLNAYVHFIYVHGVHKCLSILYCALLLVLLRFRLPQAGVACLKCDTGPHIWGGGGVNPISLLGLVTTVGVVTGQNTSRGGWWGRARPTLSRGRPWCSQGGEGKTGPDGVLQNLQYS